MELSPQPLTNENHESLVESSATRSTNTIEDVEEFTNNDFFNLNYPPMGSVINLSDDHEMNSSNTGNNEEDDEDEDDDDAIVAGPNATNKPDGNIMEIEHGRLKGFDIAKRSSGRHNKYATIICDRGRKSRAMKSSKRIGCRAKVNVVFRDNEKWQVTTVICRHGHAVDPLLSQFIPVHRTVSKHTKRVLDANDICGVRLSSSIRMVEVQAGGPENVGFARLQSKDREFFHSFKLDDVGRLLHIMWVHPRGRATYWYFHDVVTFNTTYLVNRYDMPFTTVVGMNQHGQSILLGCALLSTEHSDSFVWLFTTWLHSIDGLHPNAIITDQCESIRKAVREVMPNTRHRFCMWHIMCKVPKKLKGTDDPEAARNEFKVVVYDSLSIPTFEENWKNYVTKYGLEGNKWLLGLYAERKNWVNVYLNHLFWADMVSTQRSERMHAYFDGFLNRRSTLKWFMEQYEMAIRDKTSKEAQADTTATTEY